MLRARLGIHGRGMRLYSQNKAPRAFVRSSPIPKRAVILLTFMLGAGTAYATNQTIHESVDFSIHAIQRTTSVLDAVTRCLWNYYWVINGKFDTTEQYNEALDECHSKCAKITRRAIERNKGLFIKLGQHIAVLSHIFPLEWTQEMIPLQDQCPISSYDSINQMFIEDEGHPIDELFGSFSEQPLGTASLAQVHKATLKDGSEVAVKVQHPGLKTFIPLDVMLVGQIFTMIDMWFPEYPLSWLSDEMQNSIYTELDFREEATNATNCAEYFDNFYNLMALRVPKVYWARKRILCMEFLTGSRPDNLKALEEDGISPADLSYCFAHIFNSMIFTPGVGLHCDPHAGNMAIRPLSKEEQTKRGTRHNFEIILYDHGLYRYVPTDTRRAYAHLWLALLAQDPEKMRYYAKSFAHVDDKGFDIFVATITGRDPDHAKAGLMSKRSTSENQNMMKQIQQQELVGPIMQMLHQMPNVVLLILKTNDLVRYLDDQLDSPLGAIKSFLIMAQYCANTVYLEGVDNIRSNYGHGFNIIKQWALTCNWLSYFVTSTKIQLLSTFSWLINPESALNL